MASSNAYMPRVTRNNGVTVFLLALILVMGGYFRYVGLNWDDYTHFHPDERFLAQVVSALGGGLNFTLNGSVEGYASIQEQVDRCLERYPDTNGVGGFFDARCSNYNPHNVGHGLYVYGTLPLFTAHTASETVAQVTGDTMWASYDGAHLIWRAISAFADLCTIFVLFLIGRRLHSRWVGLIAAALYACAPLAIQLSHFATVNAMTTLFVTLAIYFAVRVQEGGRWLDYVFFGLAFAASIASRINTAPVVGLIVAAAIVRTLPVFDIHLPWSARRGLAVHHTIGLGLAGVVAIVAFRFFSPYAFEGPGILGLGLNHRFFADIANAQYQVSGASEIPPNWQWVGRPGYLFPLWNMVLWGMGAALGVAAWAGWLWSGYRLIRGRLSALRNLMPFAWVTAYFVFIGNIWVMSMRYYLPLYPALALLAAWALVEVVRRTNPPTASLWRKVGARALLGGVVGFSVLWGLMFTNIYRHQMTVVQASNWIWENVSGDFSMRIADAPPGTPMINLPLPNQFFYSEDNNPLTQLSELREGQPFTIEFTAPEGGVITDVHAPHLADPLNEGQPKTLTVSIKKAGDETVLAQAALTSTFARRRDPFGEAYTIRLDEPLIVQKGERYTFQVELVSGGVLTTAGEIMTWEGSWDEVLPVKVCELPPGVTLADDPPPGMFDARTCKGKDVWGGLLNGYKMEVVWDDVEAKRDLWLEILDNTEYIIIGTNRRYDSQSRIPARWPMTNAYYDALFDGTLGFELVAQFDETFEFGPFRVSDQYLPTYTAPRWLNEFEAEEAFHVYDHPAVMIFRKSPDYVSQRMRDILYSVSLNKIDDVTGVYSCPTDPSAAYCDPALVGVVPWYSLPADKAPTQLQLTTDMRASQYDGGTWSKRFDRNSIINAQPVVTVIAWWLVITVIGLLAWPLLFAIFPALADRGYAFAKSAGLLLTAWLAWFMSSLRVSMWSQSGILLALLVVTLFSLAMGWRARAQMAAYLREHWRRLMWIEVIALAAFLFFLLVRLTNPDLWHYAKGGEKPMDFAYFNAVLRSTIFPAIDPWYAGGFLNYYYFGFVIVGTPTLLLGIVPSIAYNLIIPTLFSLTALGAFGVAFNIASRWYQRQNARAGDDLARRGPRFGVPWVAGFAALMMAVVLGNLDTIRVLGTGIANLGGYQTSLGLEDYLVQRYAEEYGVPPEGQALARITERANANYIGDRLAYEFHHSVSLVTGLMRGFGEVLSGRTLPIGTDRWYWGPSRVLAETPGVEGNAITEMPYFTFLYGDLHAHMIDMPVMLFVMVFLFNELALAGRDKRTGWVRFVALALGALLVAITRMTNSWDWITFLLLAVLGLVYMWWLHWGRLSRWSLASFGWRVGGFVVMNFAFMAPFLSWFATTSESLAVWQGGKTPLWAYFDIHGLFLVLIVSLLIWDTARWFRSVRVGSLRGTWPLLLMGTLALVVVLLGSMIAAMRNYQITLIVVPLLVWIAILFFRPGQSRSMKYVLVLIGLGLSLTLGVEIVVLGADIGRQNTVFKFYIQTWLLFSVAGGVAFGWLLESSWAWSNRLRNGWFALTGFLVVLAALYPMMATRGRAADRMDPELPLTLDGMAYMERSRYAENGVWIDLVDDYHLIRWMQDNIEGTPVIMEGQSAHEYLWGSRIAINTGLPSIVGWGFHQTQQRTFDPLPRLVRQRTSNVNAFYIAPDIEPAWKIIEWYDIRYIVVSGLERAYYPSEGLAKFDRMVDQGLLEIAFQQDGATLYRVKENTTGAVSVAARNDE